MRYYDIYLCFDDVYRTYYEWDKDLVERVISIPVIRVLDIRDYILYNATIEDIDGYVILSDGINAIALEIANNKVIAISSIDFMLENEISKSAMSLEITNLKVTFHDLRNKFLSLPYRVLKSEIEKGSDDFIKNVYYYIFKKKSNNIKSMRKNLLNDLDSNLNDLYLNIYKTLCK